MKKLFDITDTDIYKVFTIFGFSIKMKWPKLIARKRFEENKQLLTDISNKINSLSSYIYHRDTTPCFHFRTLQHLTCVIRQHISILPTDIDLIVGVPRSGIIPAYLIALFLNKRVYTLNEFIHHLIPLHGERPVSERSGVGPKHVLVVDDSIYSGNALRKAKDKLSNINPAEYQLSYCCIYALETSKHLVDYYFEIVPHPRLFQWNYLNHVVSQSSCYDIDGVLCVDPTPEQNDDGEKYLDFLLHAKPLYIPSYQIHSIVTSRLEKYRPQTEQWLKEHHVQYKHLYMLKDYTAEERRTQSLHSAFKAKIYNKLTDCRLFIESNPKQAQEIFELTGKPVVCVETDEFYGALEN